MLLGLGRSGGLIGIISALSRRIRTLSKAHGSYQGKRKHHAKKFLHIFSFGV